ncbi:hypothetical protein NSA24_10105 [Clostridioides mangenotii]|uniref:hypothetical protein n=1 Tax=Metaclostridioides mangenotii TaxID=1540 RepID=UPI002149BD68|nr:hypothetical protein [Clostridioides mangenotii]MCR1955144.1 hypothetical protein [Clostridioides mangenotii]
MKYTKYLGLKKPESTNFYDIEDFNFNADKIDEELGNIELDANDILNKIKTVDGEGSELDADTLDGKHSTEFAASDHKHEMEDINNLNLTAENTTVKDTDNNFVSGTVEGALKELTTKDKDLDKRIVNNKEEIDRLKLSVADGKSKIATSVSGKGVPTNGSDSFQQMADNIDSIKTKLPILEGDIGVTEDFEGNVYGVEKVEYREIYYEEPMPVEEWSITTESVIKSIICNKSNDVFAILENAKVLQLDSSGSIQNRFTITEATILDKICIDEYENFYYRSGATKLNKCDKYGNKVWELEVARRIDLIQIDNTNKLVCLFVNGNALISVDFNGEIVSEFSISKSGIVQFVVDSNGNFIFRTNTTLKVFKLSKTGVLLWSGDSSPSGISYSMVIDSKDNIFTGLSANFVRFDKDGNYTAIQGYSSNYNIHSLFIDKRDNIYPSFASRWIAKYKNDTFLPVSLAWVYEHKFGSDSQILSGSVDAYSNAIYLGFDTKMKKISDNYILEKVAVLKEREVTE